MFILRIVLLCFVCSIVNKMCIYESLGHIHLINQPKVCSAVWKVRPPPSVSMKTLHVESWHINVKIRNILVSAVFISVITISKIRFGLRKYANSSFVSSF